VASKVLRQSGLVGESGVLRSGTAELLKINGDRATSHGVAARDEVLGGRQEEVECASFVCRGGGDVEIEDGGEGGVDAGEVLRAEGGGGRDGGDGHDQVGDEVVAAEGGAAGACGGRGGGGGSAGFGGGC
jgi:hypothetical protein